MRNNSITDESRPHKSRWMRSSLWIFIIIGLPVFVYFQVELYYRYAGTSALRAAIAEADASDPNWRWEDMQSERVDVQKGQDSAHVIFKTAFLLPNYPPDLYDYRNKLGSLFLPREPVPQRWSEEFQTNFPYARTALRKSHALANMSTGRFYDASPSLDLNERRWQENDHEESAVFKVSGWLQAQLFWAIETREFNDNSIALLPLMINASRAIGDRTSSLSVQRKLRARHTVAVSLERCLAHMELPQEFLDSFHREMKKDANESFLLRAARSDRAAMFDVLEEMERTGASIRSQFTLRLPHFDPRNSGMTEDAVSIWNHWSDRWSDGPIRKNRAKILDYHNRLVEAAKAPDLHVQLATIYSDFTKERDTIQWAVSEAHDALKVCSLDVTRWSTAIAAVGCERFRLTHGRWPTSLDELVPTYLEKVPTDLMTGEPLLLANQPDGIIVYSRGLNQFDDGGRIWQNGDGPLAPDLGFRLWSPEHRKAERPKVIFPLDD